MNGRDPATGHTPLKAEDLVAGEGGQREGELAQCGGVGEGHARDGRAGALEVGDLAVERRGVRGILRLEEQAEEARALVRVLLGLVDRPELGPAGLVPAIVLEAQEHQDVELARARNEIDQLDRNATVGGLHPGHRP